MKYMAMANVRNVSDFEFTKDMHICCDIFWKKITELLGNSMALKLQHLISYHHFHQVRDLLMFAVLNDKFPC